ncbi:N-acetyltransferase family protein [Plantibacter sp. 2H11-2]|uniref:GNAT family N-acetyltransferase n=1 Tax=Plantibacter sp. 2H11-2 TaxID=3414431 RepID=UPI003CFAD6D3
MRVTIDEVEIPASGSSAVFDTVQEVANTLEAEIWSTDDFALTSAMTLPDYRDQRFQRRVLLAAVLDGRVVGRGWLGYGTEADAATASLDVGVLPDARRQGIGTALLSELERRALAAGRPTVTAFTQHAVDDIPAGEPLLGASVGDRAIPANAAASRFMLDRGYALAQVERTNRCDLATTLGELPDIVATSTARAGHEYRLVHWVDRTPDELLGSLATAREHMATDIPAADLELDPEVWTPERVRAREAQLAASGDHAIVVAAVHRDSGTVAGYSELVLGEGKEHAEQWDTLVLAYHRGHGLGLWMKAANLLALADQAPERSRIYTWNADENAHMLAINDRLGFRIVGYSGEWQRRLPRSD